MFMASSCRLVGKDSVLGGLHSAIREITDMFTFPNCILSNCEIVFPFDEIRDKFLHVSPFFEMGLLVDFSPEAQTLVY